MLNFAKYFFPGFKKTLRVQNGINFAYAGPWVHVTSNSIIDEWYVGEFMAAEYTLVVDVGNHRKEIIKCLVVAGPEYANLTIYGRTNFGENLIDLTATITASKLQLIAHPTSSPDGSTYDNSSLLTGSKLIYSATYYHTINDLTKTLV
jgi:hypothetical protein